MSTLLRNFVHIDIFLSTEFNTGICVHNTHIVKINIINTYKLILGILVFFFFYKAFIEN